MTDAQKAQLGRQIDAARAELNEAQRIVALLDAQDFVVTPAGNIGTEHGDAVAVAAAVIERDLAARRVEAWTALLDRLRAEGRRLGLFQ